MIPCTVLCLLLIPCILASETMPEEERLLTHLLKGYPHGGYRRLIRPVAKTSDIITIYFGAAILEADIDEALHLLTARVVLTYVWTDVFLTWDPKEFDDIEVVRVPIDLIWHPDMKLYNSYGNSMDIDESTLVMIGNTGGVLWIPSARVATRCTGQGGRWDCSLQFASWTYDGYSVGLELYMGLQDIDKKKYNQDQWAIIDSSGSKNVKYYPCCNEPYPDITFNMTLQRGP